VTRENYMVICYVAAALCVILLLVSVFLFFKLNIIGVIGDLSGSNARKGIEDIRRQNNSGAGKVHKTGHVNRERGKVTSKITPSGNLKPVGERVESFAGTQKFHTQEIALGTVENGTTVLGAPETTVLSAGFSNETTVLAENGANETTVLADNSYYTVPAAKETVATRHEITIIEDITFVHSNEQI